MPVDRPALGASLKAARLRAKLSQAQVAAEVAARLGDDNLDPSNVSRWEKGTQAMSLDQLQAMADIVGITFEALLEESGLIQRDRPVRDHIASDPLLDEEGRKAFLYTYDRLVGTPESAS